jgi:hypothetical protein
MTSKWQKYLAIGVIILVVVLVVFKLAYNYKLNRVVWDDDDAEKLTNACLDDLAGYAVRFPSQSEEYCSCTSDTLIKHFNKADYLRLENEGGEKQREQMLPVVADCYNTFQEAIFRASRLD